MKQRTILPRGQRFKIFATSEGLDLIMTRLDERTKRRNERWAKRFALITGTIGFASILGFPNGLRNYLILPDTGDEPPSVLALRVRDNAGRDLLLVYGGVLLLVLSVFLWTRFVTNRR